MPDPAVPALTPFRAAPGRKPTHRDEPSGVETLLGIDLGGTKSAAIVATPDGTLLHRVSAPTPAHGDGATLHAFLRGLALDVLEQTAASPVGCGISAGAPTDNATGTVFAAPNLPGWGAQGDPLAERLSADLGGLPIRIENDADATAMAEHRYGAGRGTRTMAFLTIGTGVGAGLVLGGKLHRGMRGAGGEIGHIAVVPRGGRTCPCGLRGCLEAYASGPSVVRVAIERGYQGDPTGAAVAAAARAGDPAASHAFRQAAEMLGRGLATLTMLLNPERIVLGTLAVHAGDLLIDPIRRTISRRVWARLDEGLTVVPAALGDRAQDLAALCAWLGPGAP
ncbi:MAG: ROK family protein [Armatimonadota bacterium]